MTQREVLAAAISYALQGAALVTSACLDQPTPCAEWDVRMLLVHLATSMAAIEEALGSGQLTGPGPDEWSGPGDPVELLRDRAAGLLVTTFLSDMGSIEIAGIPVPAEVIRGTGALETAVHGWDIYTACGHHRPVPNGVARPLLAMLSQLIPARDGLFAGPVAAPPCASPGDRLIAALGRSPVDTEAPGFRNEVTGE
ncbi:MAG TPA: TIGR03086 family metal-binding protein [Streptosporangiaceae bacterium]|nr:TIGR03086 family metal-binding protein [Streptosporangiaceae bacterium]